MSLIDKVNAFNIIYKWFDYLKAQGHFINAFVIMLNHVHVIISFIETEQSINNIIVTEKDLWLTILLKSLRKTMRLNY